MRAQWNGDVNECNEIRAHLDGYRDDALPADLRTLVEGHLAKCDECQEILLVQDRSEARVKDYFRSTDVPEL